jgi:hypothetical protein
MRIITLPAARPAVPYFSSLHHIRHDYRKKLLNIKCVSLFRVQILSKTFLILRRSQRGIIIKVHSVTVGLVSRLSDVRKYLC